MANDLKGQQWWQEKIILLWDNQMTISIRRIGKSFELAYVCRWSKNRPKKDKLFSLQLLYAEVCPMPSVILCYICRVKA